MSPLSFRDLEELYDQLAQAIDRAGPEQESIFLAKLVLRLAHEFGDGPRVRALVEECLHEAAPPAGAHARLI
jgi:hypothetical protein